MTGFLAEGMGWDNNGKSVVDCELGGKALIRGTKISVQILDLERMAPLKYRRFRIDR